MANEQNLRPFTSNQNREEAVKNGRKGGKASGQARRERRRFEETLRIMLVLPTKQGKVTDAAKLKTLSKDELESVNLTVQDKIAVRLINEAMKGNTKAYEIIRDTMGEDTNQPVISPLDRLAAVLEKYQEDEDE